MNDKESMSDHNSMFHLIEDTCQQNILNKDKQIEELTLQINFLQDQLDNRQVSIHYSLLDSLFSFFFYHV